MCGRSRPEPGLADSGSRGGLRARCRRYLLLSYCRYLFCTVSAAFVLTIKRFNSRRLRVLGGRQGALPRGGAAGSGARALRPEGGSGGAEPGAAAARRVRAMAAGGSLSRSERKAAARAEILLQEEQRDRRRQVRYDAARPAPPRRCGPP